MRAYARDYDVFCPLVNLTKLTTICHPPLRPPSITHTNYLGRPLVNSHAGKASEGLIESPRQIHSPLSTFQLAASLQFTYMHCRVYMCIQMHLKPKYRYTGIYTYAEFMGSSVSVSVGLPYKLRAVWCAAAAPARPTTLYSSCAVWPTAEQQGSLVGYCRLPIHDTSLGKIRYKPTFEFQVQNSEVLEKTEWKYPRAPGKSCCLMAAGQRKRFWPSSGRRRLFR